MNIKHSGHVRVRMQSSSSQPSLRKWKTLVSSAAVVALALTLASCGDDGEDGDAGSDPTNTAAAGELPTGTEPQPLDQVTKIRVGQAVKTEAFLPLIVADAMGEFEKENLDVEISVAPDPASTIPLLDQ